MEVGIEKLEKTVYAWTSRAVDTLQRKKKARIENRVSLAFYYTHGVLSNLDILLGSNKE
jgi:hypothetical protein